jgi:uncharacterized protein (DUF488 family)
VSTLSQKVLYTVGHSNQSFEDLLCLLKKHDITAIADVRSHPFSKMNPQFNREVIAKSLRKQGIAYVFLGKELGARSEDPACYENGKVQYSLLAKTGLFRVGVKRVLKGMEKYRVALMCAEKEPIVCHRAILVARQISLLDVDIRHIHAGGEMESQEALSERLLEELKMDGPNVLYSKRELMEEAFWKQGSKLAYERDVPFETV